jgi:hypothetical protein
MKTEFSNIKNLVDKTTATNKNMTFLVTYKDKLCVVKKFSKKNTAIDNIIVNEIKDIFGLNKLSNMEFFESYFDISAKTNKVFKNKNNVIKYFLITDFVPSSQMISDDIDVLEDSDILYEYIKCAMYRGIWRVTDFWAGNILISDYKLYSIDENDIGKQKNIIKKRDINNYIKNGITINIVEDIINKFKSNYENNKTDIENILNKFDRTKYISLIEYNLLYMKKDICNDLSL